MRRNFQDEWIFKTNEGNFKMNFLSTWSHIHTAKVVENCYEFSMTKKKKKGPVHRKLEVMAHVTGENKQELVRGDSHAVINLRNLHFIKTFHKWSKAKTCTKLTPRWKVWVASVARGARETLSWEGWQRRWETARKKTTDRVSNGRERIAHFPTDHFSLSASPFVILSNLISSLISKTGEFDPGGNRQFIFKFE